MKKNDLEKSLVSEWMNSAASDFALAKKGKVSTKVQYYSLCFHAQQAAEKAIKAVLLFHKITFPKTHNIEHLLKLLKNANINVPKVISKAQPDDIESLQEIDMKEYKSAVAIAEKVLKWASLIIFKQPDKLF